MHVRIDHVDYGFSIIHLTASDEWLATWVCWECGASAGGNALGTHSSAEIAEKVAIKSLRSHHQNRHAPEESLAEFL